MAGKNKNKLGYELKIREALEIKHNCGPGKGLNEDNPMEADLSQNGTYVRGR